MTAAIQAENPLTIPVLPPGTHVGGFVLAESIGHGGFSVVYRARQVKLDREVALKILRPQVEIDPQADQRFYNEARHTVAAGHPGITTVYEYDKLEDGPSYIAMEFLQGRTLDKIIAFHEMKENGLEAPLIRIAFVFLGGNLVGFSIRVSQ